MEAKLRSEGKCVFCENTYTKSGIGRHLKSHLDKIQKEENAQKQYAHLLVEADVMFLQILIDANAKLSELDEFLRAIWLECCGHMSAFMVKNYVEIGMRTSIKKAFSQHPKLEHHYDFGTTTRLDVKCYGFYTIPKQTESLILLSRNEPLEILCEVCHKTSAFFICEYHEMGEPTFFCKKCIKKHEDECEMAQDGGLLDVCNSPRMGSCAYEGGTIDTERDGIFQKK